MSERAGMAERDAAGFPQGSGIFETIRTENGKVVALARHMRRALKSAEDLGFTLPDEESLRKALAKKLEESAYPIGRLRLCFAEDFFDISHDPYEEKPNSARINFYSTSVTGSLHKKYPYDERLAILALAQQEAFDESLLFNNSNQITETATANVIFRIDSEWVTPPLSAGILPGVMRALAIEKCGVKVASIHISQIPEITSGLLVSSLRIATHISHIGDMALKVDQESEQLVSQIRACAQPDSVG
jgi:branched-chain amino acid aminotransferase